MELQRIISMFLVMIIHADFLALGTPTQEDLTAEPMDTFIRYLIGGMSSVCVNVFVMISGWYGISFSLKRIGKLLFQTFFFIFLIFLFLVPKDLSACLTEAKNFILMEDYWFIAAYLLLCIMAPALNTFSEHASPFLLRNVLVAFFIYQTIFSYLGNSPWYDDGYSPLPFFGLYLYARYLRLCHNKFSSFNKGWDILIWVVFSVIIAILSMILLSHGTGGRLYNYTSPLILVSSTYFFLFFTKINLKNNVINWIGKSCFAAFLVQMNPHFTYKYYIEPIYHWHSTESGIIMVIHTASYILFIFLIAILLDQLQRFCSHLLKLDH